MSLFRQKGIAGASGAVPIGMTATNGDVTGARRETQGSNSRWVMTRQPDGDGDGIIALPVTTDCGDDGAVCTQDGRMLSNRTSITVPG